MKQISLVALSICLLGFGAVASAEVATKTVQKASNVSRVGLFLVPDVKGWRKVDLPSERSNVRNVSFEQSNGQHLMLMRFWWAKRPKERNHLDARFLAEFQIKRRNYYPNVISERVLPCY